MTKEEIIKSIVCDVKDYRFTHDELMRMSKKELLQYYPRFNSEKPNNHEGLDEAAKEYCPDDAYPFASDIINKEVRKAFIAGAEWQKQHDAELIEIAYNDGITIGITKQKEQMMKEAVEGEVMTNGFYPYEPRIVASYPNCPYNFGDKVRIIIVKEN